MRSYIRPGEVSLAPPSASPVTGGGRLAIVVPLISGVLTADEQVGMGLLRRFGGDWPKFVLHPAGLELGFHMTGLVSAPLDPANFDGISAYNAMLMSAWFYRLFEAYDHILIFQTDCLLLSGEIAPWLDRPWSYSGAPYFRRNGQLKSVGNGGFSLRRVADHIAVLDSGRLSLARTSPAMARQYLKSTYLKYLLVHLARPARQQGAAAFVAQFDRAEDEFWIYYAPLFSPRFSLPPAEAMAGFAAESRPRRVVELNGGRLPLGAHAWAKHDRAFWVEVLRDRLGVEVP